ncbi:MAG: 30S ribosomal protein S1, partial [Alphaproteobacteria bacterium]|nr:30S ribosomal protein S1 [Alphaproteobacteria bacterium]
MSTQTKTAQSTSKESFADLLEESLGTAEQSLVGRVVKGLVVNLDNEIVSIDVGLKSEGRIPLREFGISQDDDELKVGDEIDVFVERFEGKNGETVLSREKARREAAWVQLEKSHEKGERVVGVMYSRVKGGFTVDLAGAVAFLPGSQVDIRPIRDVDPLMGVAQPFMILKMDRTRGNIVVSRRAVLEESREEAKTELVSNLSEGQVIEGVVKNITDYGAFVDLGGIDGLLHVTDISWMRVNHPSEILQVGQPVKVQIIKFNKETNRISLGIKQLQTDPWEGVEARYVIGKQLSGKVTNITDYGAFIELEPGIEGLVHVSEMSWTKKNVHPGKIISTSQEVDVKVLDVDPVKRRISLGIKQCKSNPWKAFADANPVGTELEGEIKNTTDFGMFVGLNEEIDGMVHASDLSWDKPGNVALKDYSKGQIVKVKILDVDPDKERISLGVKQLAADTVGETLSTLKTGATVTCTVSKILDSGIEVSLPENIRGFIRKSDLARNRGDQRTDRFAEGEKVDAVVMSVEKGSRHVGLSIKAHEVHEEKQAMEEYGSSDSGASLGDILGAAIDRAKDRESDTSSEPKAKETKKKATTSKKADEEKAAKKEPATKTKEITAKAKAEKKTTKATDTKKAEKKTPAKKADTEKKTAAKKETKK